MMTAMTDTVLFLLIQGIFVCLFVAIHKPVRLIKTLACPKNNLGKLRFQSGHSGAMFLLLLASRLYLRLHVTISMAD